MRPHTPASLTDPGAGHGAGARLEAHALAWTPAGASAPVLPGVDLCVPAGQRVLLAGASGAGKSTLLRALAGVLGEVDPGRGSGQVLLDGVPVRPGDGRVGLLVQDPADARVAATVGRDVAFGPENLGVPRAELPERVRQALAAVGFPYGPDHPAGALSGGQAQRLALAGLLALRPQVLLLDEPTSMLDARSAAVVRAGVDAAATATGATVIVVEHRLDGWVDAVDRLVVLGRDGAIVADGPARQVVAQQADTLLDVGVWVPGRGAPALIEVPPELVAPAYAPPAGGLAAAARGVGLTRRTRRGLAVQRRRPEPIHALQGVDLDVRAGQLHALAGPSGAGKSSLLSALAGLIAPTSGSVSLPGPGEGTGRDAPHRLPSRELARRVAWVPQRAEATIVGDTVSSSLLATARALGHSERAAQTRGKALLELLGLAHLAGRHPHRLSGGEARRLAVATALVHGPGVLALDEPTVGQDRHTWAAVASLAVAARDAGVAVVAGTHDEHLLTLADRVTHLTAGRVAAASPVAS